MGFETKQNARMSEMVAGALQRRMWLLRQHKVLGWVLRVITVVEVK